MIFSILDFSSESELRSHDQSFSKVCVFSEFDPSTRSRYCCVFKSFHSGERFQKFAYSSFHCGRDMKTQQNVCVFKWKRIRVDEALVTSWNTLHVTWSKHVSEEIFKVLIHKDTTNPHVQFSNFALSLPQVSACLHLVWANKETWPFLIYILFKAIFFLEPKVISQLK